MMHVGVAPPLQMPNILSAIPGNARWNLSPCPASAFIHGGSAATPR
jgi:hypothetical protein